LIATFHGFHGFVVVGEKRRRLIDVAVEMKTMKFSFFFIILKIFGTRSLIFVIFLKTSEQTAVLN